VFGCPPGSGIREDSKFVVDIINLLKTNSDIINNFNEIPRVYNKVKPTDCKLEIATSNLA
jgi:hypothetical protein